MSTEQQEEEVIPDETDFNRFSGGSSSSSDDGQAGDDMIGCIPEEQEGQLSDDDEVEQLPVDEETNEASSSAGRGGDMDLLKAILQEEQEIGGGCGDDVIPEETEEDQEHHEGQDHHENQAQHEQDHHENQAQHDGQDHHENQAQHEQDHHENQAQHEQDHHENQAQHERQDHHENQAQHERQDHHENQAQHEGQDHHENQALHEQDHHEDRSQHELDPENRESHPENNEQDNYIDPKPADPGKKQKRKKRKSKKSLKPPLAPWSRASINTLSRQPQPQPLLSDRSGSVATAGTGASRASRALSAKELREKFRPVSNEEKLSRNLEELDSLLAIDYAKQARLAYQRSVAECRQSWQNYVSTARIMGDAPDQQKSQQQSRLSTLHPDEAYPPSQDDAMLSNSAGHPLGRRVAPEISSDSQLSMQHQQQKELSEDEGIQRLHGYRVGAPERGSAKFGSDHKLSESANPDVRAWLKEKNQSARRERREAKEAKRREMQAKLDAQQRRSERRAEAEASYQHWMQAKQQQQSDSESRKKSPARKTPANEPTTLPLADQESVFAELEHRRQSPPGPKPVHNSVFKRASPYLGQAGASFSGRQVRMGVVGRRLETSASTSALLAIEQPEQQQLRLSHADWSQRKATQQSAELSRQREAERQRREAAAAADPQMAALVPQLARRRIRTAVELKSNRTDTGLGLARPRTAVPALAAPPAQPSRRPPLGRARTSSMERREAEITERRQNPFVMPDQDRMLDRMLGGGGGDD